MSLIGDPTLSLLNRGLDVSLARQNILTANVANLDTPGYTPSDVDFASALRDAIDGGHVRLRQAHLGHSRGMAGAGAMGSIETHQRPDTTPGGDGNSVDLDAQMARLSQNAIFYQAQTRVVSKKLAMLKYAVSEGAL